MSMQNRDLSGVNPRDLSKLDFVDYYRLRSDIEAEKKGIPQSILLHDGDEITFLDMYKTLKLITSEIMQLLDANSNFSVDLLFMLISYLVEKGILDTKDLSTLSEGAITLVDETRKDLKKKD